MVLGVRRYPGEEGKVAELPVLLWNQDQDVELKFSEAHDLTEVPMDHMSQSLDECYKKKKYKRWV